MPLYTVHHTTAYRYRRPVRLGQHQMLFRPRDSFDQRLLACHLEVTPEPAEVRWIHDVFGNCLTLVDFDISAEALEFETTIHLDHTPENTPDFRIEEYAREHPFTYDRSELPDLEPYIRRHFQDDRTVDNWLSKFIVPGQSQPTGRLLMTLNEAISEGFSYRRRTARGRRRPPKLWVFNRGRAATSHC